MHIGHGRDAVVESRGDLRWAMGGGRRCGSGLFWCCWAARTRGLGRVTGVTRMEFAAAIPRLTPCGSGFSLWRQAGELMARCVILKAGGEGRTVGRALIAVTPYGGVSVSVICARYAAWSKAALRRRGETLQPPPVITAHARRRPRAPLRENTSPSPLPCRDIPASSRHEP